jgi:hypothetical protein
MRLMASLRLAFALPRTRLPNGRTGLSASLGSAALAFACSSEPDLPRCIEVSTECSSVVSPPTFDAIYDNVLRPSCATGTGSCHNRGAGGLDMRSADAAFDGLKSRVTPGDPSCSVLNVRLEASDSSRRMPPGPTPLSEAQRCAVRQWIANGAER